MQVYHMVLIKKYILYTYFLNQGRILMTVNNPVSETFQFLLIFLKHKNSSFSIGLAHAEDSTVSTHVHVI